MAKEKNYDHYLKEYLKGFKHLKHLFFAENPLDAEDAKDDGKMLNYFYYPKGSQTNYFTAVYVGLGFNKTYLTKKDRLEEMQKAGVLVWDIFHNRKEHLDCDYCKDIKAGVKITSGQRTEMIQNGCSLHAFQSSVKALNELNIDVDKNLNIYFMMPQLTSLPIFNFYNNKSMELKIKGIEVSKMMRKGNPLVPEEGYEQEIFPRHMINVIGGSNTPRANLVKYARDCQNDLRDLTSNEQRNQLP